METEAKGVSLANLVQKWWSRNQISFAYQESQLALLH